MLNKLNRPERRRLILFIICLIVATCTWAFSELSNQYVYKIKALIHYTHTPKNLVFYPLQADTLHLEIEGTGWQVLYGQIKVGLRHINIDVEDLSDKHYVILNNQLRHIHEQLEDDQQILSIKPDTLFFNFSKRFTKHVPVELVEKLAFDKRYAIAGKIEVQPKFVNLTGSLQDLESIHVWQTDTLKLDEVTSSIETKLALKRPENIGLKLQPKYVKVTIPVDEFTEKIIEVPLKILNNSNFDQVELAPKFAKITIRTALGNYEQIDPTFFEASVDLDKWRKNGYERLPVVLNRFPDYCKLVRIEPQNVDFIINQ